MSRKHSAIASHEKFVAQFMSATAETLLRQDKLIQVYPLSMASSLIRLPTPLFRAQYNFLLLFSAGGGQQQVDGEVLTLAPNDVLFIRDGHLNAIKSIESDTDGYFIYIDSVLLPQIAVDSALLHRLTFYPKHTVPGPEMHWLCQCCELLRRQTQGSAYSQEIQTALLRAVFLKLAAASATVLCKPDRQWEVTMQFKELLYQKFRAVRDVKYYADALAVSENYLNRCVNHITTKPPKQHINEMVIAHSKVLLQDHSKDIAQVAFELNFSDPSYFGRLFRQLTQQTPTQYRSGFAQGLSG